MANIREQSAEKSQAVRSFIESQIASGVWKPGDRVPTERVLAEKYGLARNTVRAVLQELERDGLISRHIGRGTFVTGRNSKPSGRPDMTVKDASPSDIMEVRLLVEPGMSELAVLRANQSDLDYLRKCLERGEAAKSWREFEQWDAEFHKALALATKNRAVIDILQSINHTRDQSIWGELKKKSLTPARRKIYEGQHRAILEALMDRDSEGVRTSVERHLYTVRENLLGY